MWIALIDDSGRFTGGTPMTRLVQIIFRNMAVAPTLEREVHARAAWLETFYGAIVGRRVLIEFPHRHRSKGRPVHIRIDLAVPGEDIIVDQNTTRHFSGRGSQADRAHRAEALKSAHQDVVAAIHDAFDVARRRLEDFARKRADIKTHQPDAA
jgi:hypothetical protein